MRVEDCEGRPIGSLVHVYEDDDGAPAWFLVRLGSFSSRYVFVPHADVLVGPGYVCLPYGRPTIEAAPKVFAPPAEVPVAMEQRLRRHFRLDAGGPPAMHVRARRSVA